MTKGFIWIWVCGSFCLSFCPSFCLEVHLELVHKFFLKRSMILRDWLCVVELDFFFNLLSTQLTKNIQKWSKVGDLDSLLNCWLEFVQNKSSNGAVTLCKNCISDKILVHKLEAKIFLPYQIPGFLSSVSLKGIIEYQRVLSINRVWFNFLKMIWEFF